MEASPPLPWLAIRHPLFSGTTTASNPKTEQHYHNSSRASRSCIKTLEQTMGYPPNKAHDDLPLPPTWYVPNTHNTWTQYLLLISVSEAMTAAGRARSPPAEVRGIFTSAAHTRDSSRNTATAPSVTARRRATTAGTRGTARRATETVPLGGRRREGDSLRVLPLAER